MSSHGGSLTLSQSIEAHAPVYEAVVPTNIALLKYWGKRDEATQWPTNDSLSLTLSELATRTRAWKDKSLADHSIVLNGKEEVRGQGPGRKAFEHLDYLARRFRWKGFLRITSENSFPTGCGIASSASGLAALSLAAAAAWTEAGSWEELGHAKLERETLAHLARMGSGSACRSLWAGVVLWQAGESPSEQKVGPVFSAAHWPLEDTVVLFSEEPKGVSSSQGHRYAKTSPLFAPRLACLAERGRRMLAALATRNMEALGPLIEQEAIEMHGIMMSANPAIRYFGEATSAFLAWLCTIRRREGLAVYFTLDAGPNVHVIGEPNEQARLHELLAAHQPKLRYLHDRMGLGPSIQRCSL